MTEHQPRELDELDQASWIRHHLLEIGAAVTIAAVSAAAVQYERHRRRRAAVEEYAAKRDIFEFKAEKPSDTAQMLRKITAASLVKPEGATQKQLRVQAPLPRNNLSFGDGLRILVGQGILVVEEREKSKDFYFSPSIGFTTALHEEPEKWHDIIVLAQELNKQFDVERLPALAAADFSDFPTDSW